MADQPNVQSMRLTAYDGVNSSFGDLSVNVVSSRRRRSVDHILQPILNAYEWFGSSAGFLTPLPFMMLLAFLILFLFY